MLTNVNVLYVITNTSLPSSVVPVRNKNIYKVKKKHTHKLQHGPLTGNLTCRVFAIDVIDGSVKAVITINNATNCDWEDISVGIGRGGLWYIYVGDIGGNAGSSNQDISQMFSWYKLY